MKELAERLWPAFRAEVAEQLEALELLLVQRSGAAPADVNALFRHFHTIKGGCAMMGYTNMGALAHAAEDALDPVRRQERVLDEALVSLLLTVLDALKQQLQETERSRQDPAPHTALVAQLRATAATAPAPAPASVPATTTAAPAAKTGRGKVRSGSAQHAAGRPAAPLPAAAPDGRRHHSFADAARTVLPALLVAALRGTTLPAVASLRSAAESAGLTAIARLLAHLDTTASNPRSQRLLLAEMLDRIAGLELETGIDAGVHAAALAARAEAAAPLAASAHAVLATLAAPAVPEPDQALAAGEDLLALALLLQLRQTTRLLRLVSQVLRDVARRGLIVDSELQELLLLAAGMTGELQADHSEDPPYVAMCTSLYQRLQEAASSAAAGREVATLQQRILAAIDIRRDLLDALQAPALARLADVINHGETVVEIEADMEAAPDNGSAFIAWLDANGAQLGNQTVFHREVAAGSERESTRLRFLAAMPLPLPDIRIALGRLDPNQQLFTLRHCAPHAGEPSGAGISTPTPATAGATAAANAGSGRNNQTLRVDSEAVDQFVNRIGELVTLRNMMAHALGADDSAARQRRLRSLLGSRSAAQPLSDAELDELRALLAADDARHERLQQTDLRMQGALGRMQEDVLALRVVPIGMVFNRLPRVVRDLSQAQQKKISLEVVGEDVRVDKSLVDVLLEPLMHLVRNAVDHGLEAPAQRLAAGKPEMATLSLLARQQGGSLIVEVADDGRGLDLDRIRRRALDSAVLTPDALDGLSARELANLIFLPGFSTAEQVTEVSGRGVGMDVVKTRIAQIGGQVEVRSQPGRGTTFTLKLPLSVAIQSVILVAAGDRQLALPERNVAEIISMPASALLSVQGQACCLLRGSTLPVYHLGALLGATVAAGQTGTLTEVVVLTDGVYRVGMLVDRVLGRPEVFVRDVHADIARLPGVGGVSILGNGQVVIIVDCEKLFELALRNAQSLRGLLSVS